jgi:hypothetical protein
VPLVVLVLVVDVERVPLVVDLLLVVVVERVPVVVVVVLVVVEQSVGFEKILMEEDGRTNEESYMMQDHDLETMNGKIVQDVKLVMIVARMMNLTYFDVRAVHLVVHNQHIHPMIVRHSLIWQVQEEEEEEEVACCSHSNTHTRHHRANSTGLPSKHLASRLLEETSRIHSISTAQRSVYLLSTQTSVAIPRTLDHETNFPGIQTIHVIHALQCFHERRLGRQ